jgi:cytochrome c-type biogenesis protein
MILATIAVTMTTFPGCGNASAMGPLVGQPAPMVDVFGAGVDTLVLNFWSSSCGPCKEELPDLQAIHEGYGAECGVKVVGIVRPADAEAAREVADEHGVTFPVVANSLAWSQYGVTGTPETFVVKGGEIVAHFVGTVSARSLMEVLYGTTN